MSGDNYITVTSVDSIEENRVSCFRAGGVSIVICRVAGDFYAVENRCSHADATFDNGRLRGHRLLCPLHGAVFDVRDGSVLGAPALQSVRSYPVRINGDAIEVDIGS